MKLLMKGWVKYKTDVNKLILIIYYLKGESSPKDFISFKGPLTFYKKIKNGHITLEKERLNLNQIQIKN